MRKFILMAMLALARLFTACGATETTGGYTWTYRIVGNGAEIYSSYTCAVSPTPTGSLTIPLKLGGYPVTSIGSYAFCDCSSLTSVTIPSSVTSIGSYAFYKCSGLGDGVVVVDGWVLAVNGTCPASVEIPEGTHGIAGGAFSWCSGLTSVTIPDGVTSIGERAFDGCSGMVCVTFEGASVEIDATAFAGVGSNARRCRLVLPEGWTGETPQKDGGWRGGRFALPGTPQDSCRIALTPPENTAVVVTANGVAVEPVEGVYTVGLDITVTVDFTAAPGYVLKGQASWKFVTTQDVAFGEGDFAYPTVRMVSGSGT